MSIKPKRIFWPLLLTLLAATVTLAVIKARIHIASNIAEAPSAQVMSPSSDQQRSGNSVAQRNLSLQPEAFKLSRRLGKRFSPGKRELSVLVGTLEVGPKSYPVRMTRRQTDAGEQVEIALSGKSDRLTWAEGQGAASTGALAESDRDLIERLVFDSPDQFVLAQLRGASYYTMGRNVRPEEAGDGDGYAGPVWNIVRISEPQGDEAKRPRSPWRLYHLNTNTGLIDRIISEIEGERIVASISEWTEIDGEKIPGKITWTRQQQVVMQFSLTNFSHGRQQKKEEE